MLTAGHLLADRYRLGRRIAVGGMGEVWEAEDARLDRRVAVKVLKAELCGDAEFLHRFRTEARTTASLNHPGVAGVHDYGETAAIVDGPQDTAYLVMELVEGEPLAAILARDGRLSAERVLDMLEQAGHALQAAHVRGLVHRDIKPGNILLTASGVVKLTDFGIAKAADAAPVTRSGMVMGTAHYIAPEQAVGEEAAPASDVYSLAVVGYECLCGHRPFLSDNAVTVAMMHIRDLPPPLPPDVPRGVRALIEATLVKDPRQRYGTGGEFAAAVAAVRAGRALPAPSGFTPPAAMEAHTPPTGTPVLAAPPTGPQTPSGAPTPGGPSGMLPVQTATQQDRTRSTALLWALAAVLVAAAIGLLIWGLVASNSDRSGQRDTGGEQTEQQARVPVPDEGNPGGTRGDRPAPGGAGQGERGPAGSGGPAGGSLGGGTGDRDSAGSRGSGDGSGGSNGSNGSGGGSNSRGGAGDPGTGPAPTERPGQPSAAPGGDGSGAQPGGGVAGQGDDGGPGIRGIVPPARQAPAPETPFPPTSRSSGVTSGSATG